MYFLEFVVEYQSAMEKEGQKGFGRSFIQRNHLDKDTGRQTADLDSRYGRERKGLPKVTALEMLRLDDVVATAGIKQGDQIDVLIKVKEKDQETGKLRTVQKWQEPFDGEKFAGVDEGKLVLSAPSGSNVPLEYLAEDIIHIRKHKEPEKGAENNEFPNDSSKQGIEGIVERAGLQAGDSFVFEERRVSEDPATGHPVERRSWLGMYGVVFDGTQDGHLMVRDSTGASTIVRPLSIYRDIKDLRKAEPLPYPFSDRK